MSEEIVKSNAGRKTKFTYQRIRIYLRELEKGYPVKVAIRRAGWSEAGKSSYIKEYPKFLKLEQRAKLIGDSELITDAIKCVKNSLKKDYFPAAKFVLENKLPHEYNAQIRRDPSEVGDTNILAIIIQQSLAAHPGARKVVEGIVGESNPSAGELQETG